MKLRGYEASWIRRIRKSKSRKLLIVGPTGSGKTVVAAHLIQGIVRAGKRVLFFAHRKELVEQCVERLKERGVSGVGVIMAGFTEDRSQPVQVASIHTLMNRRLPRADVLFVDEAHHATAKSYSGMMSALPRAQLYGLTATPARLDGKPLGDVFDEIVPGPLVSELVGDGWLSNPRVFSRPSADLRRVRIVDGDYKPGELCIRLNRREIVGDIVRHWKRYASSFPTVAYAVNVRHAVNIARKFSKAGVKVETLTGMTPSRERRSMLQGLSDGRVQVVVNVGVLTEGWDCPAAACCVIARPTLSLVLHLQMCGRIMRPKAGRPVILDHVGNCLLHGLPSEDHEWSLDGNADLAKHGGIETISKQCPECDTHCHIATRVCPWCGYEFWLQVPPADVTRWLEEVRTSPRERAVQLIRGGMSRAEVARRFGVCENTARNWAAKAGLKGDVVEACSDEEVESVLEMVRKRIPISEIAKESGIGVCRIRGWAKMAGVEVVNRTHIPRDKLNEAFSLVRGGKSIRAASFQVGLNPTTVGWWCKKRGIGNRVKRVSAEERASALGALRNGVSLYVVADEVDVSVETIKGWARRAGIELPKCAPINRVSIGVENRIVELLLVGTSIHKIAIETGVCRSTVYGVINRRGMERTTPYVGKWNNGTGVSDGT